MLHRILSHTTSLPVWSFNTWLSTFNGTLKVWWVLKNIFRNTTQILWFILLILTFFFRYCDIYDVQWNGFIYIWTSFSMLLLTINTILTFDLWLFLSYYSFQWAFLWHTTLTLFDMLFYKSLIMFSWGTIFNIKIFSSKF